MKAVVEMRELTKRFGDNYALAGLTMAVPREPCLNTVVKSARS
jgi:ABC-type transporter Mla maintaining outer membrane lipid asymmetry ATPase subunit MlaF